MADGASSLPGSLGYKSFHHFIWGDDEWDFKLFRSIITVCSTPARNDTKKTFPSTKFDLGDPDSLKVWARIMHEVTKESLKFNASPEDKLSKVNFSEISKVRTFISEKGDFYWSAAFQPGPGGSPPDAKWCNEILWPWKAYVEHLKGICVDETILGYHKDGIPEVTAADIQESPEARRRRDEVQSAFSRGY